MIAPDPLATARAALAGRTAWLVGGAVRDGLLGRERTNLDLDLVVADGDVEGAARALGRRARGPAFALSEAFGAWRVIGPGRCWQADLNPLRGGSLAADLALRDFTVNAMAEPLAGGPRVDPYGGAADLAARRLRMVAPRAFADDPLRVVRLARLAEQLDLVPEPDTESAARAAAPGLAGVAGERVFAELRHLLAPAGIERLRTTGALAVVLPEVAALHGVAQTVYHHKDAYGHTLEVLEHAIALEHDPGTILGAPRDAPVRAFLAEPLADELDRAGALRWGALLHDVAKPRTATANPKGGFGFPGHERLGAEMTRAILGRLRASAALTTHVADLARHHLHLGFLVRRRPLPARAVFAYLRACAPVEVDVTLLTVADRLATRGRKAEAAIADHLDLARTILDAALAWHRDGPPRPLVRGDDLARALDIAPGPEVGRLLEELAEAQYAGEVATPEQALDYARGLAASA